MSHDNISIYKTWVHVIRNKPKLSQHGWYQVLSSATNLKPRGKPSYIVPACSGKCIHIVDLLHWENHRDSYTNGQISDVPSFQGLFSHTDLIEEFNCTVFHKHTRNRMSHPLWHWTNYLEINGWNLKVVTWMLMNTIKYLSGLGIRNPCVHVYTPVRILIHK